VNTRKREARWRAPFSVAKGANTTTITARLLEQSKQRKIWSRLLDWRDWVSYLYLPIFAVILLVGPYIALRFFQLYQSNRQKQTLLEVIAGGSEDFRTVSGLLEYGAPTEFGDQYKIVEQFAPISYEGFDWISETQVYDQRKNIRRNGESSKWRYYTHRRYRVARTDATEPLRVRFRVDGADSGVHCLNTDLKPQFLRRKAFSEGWSYWELAVDLSQLAEGDVVDVVIETESWKPTTTEQQQDWKLEIMPPAQFGIISMWALLPEQSHFTGFDLYKRTSPEDKTLRRIEPTTGNTRSSGTVIAWSLVNPEPRHIYQCHWVQSHVGTLQKSLQSLPLP